MLATSIGALRELVSDGVDGYLADPVSEADWADKMITLFDEHERTRRMGTMGWNKTVTGFTTDRVATHMERVYGALLGR